ncbi:unnamed protein product, partial [Ixodes hexagonus]
QGSPGKKPFVPWSIRRKESREEGSVRKDYPDELSDTEVYDVKRFYLWPLSIFNFIFMLLCGLLFGGALYSLFDEASAPVNPPSSWLVLFIQNIDVLLLFVSGFLFVTASIGLIGTVRENISLLELYRTILTAIVVLTTFSVVFLALLPTMGKAYILANITPSVIAHYRDTPDMMKASGRGLASYLEGNIINTVLIGMLFLIFMFYLIALSASVRSEVKALSKVYEKYYKTVFHGQVRMVRRYQHLKKMKGSPKTDERVAAIILGHQEPGKARGQRAPLSPISP